MQTTDNPTLDDVSDYDLKRAMGHAKEALDRVRRAEDALGEEFIEATMYENASVACDLTAAEATLDEAIGGLLNERRDRRGGGE